MTEVILTTRPIRMVFRWYRDGWRLFMDRKLVWFGLLLLSKGAAVFQAWVAILLYQALDEQITLQLAVRLSTEGTPGPLIVLLLAFAVNWIVFAVIWMSSLVQLGLIGKTAPESPNKPSRVRLLLRIVCVLLFASSVQSVATFAILSINGLAIDAIRNSLSSVIDGPELVIVVLASLPSTYVNGIATLAVVFILPLVLVSHEPLLALLMKNIVAWFRHMRSWLLYACVPIIGTTVVQVVLAFRLHTLANMPELQRMAMPLMLAEDISDVGFMITELLKSGDTQLLTRAAIIITPALLIVLVWNLLLPWLWLARAAAFQQVFSTSRQQTNSEGR